MRSLGCNNEAISSYIMEKIARDPKIATRYEKLIADVLNVSKIMEKGIVSHSAEMIACGVSIDENGKVSYWSVSKHKLPKYNSYKEKIENNMNEKREKKKEEKAK